MNMITPNFYIPQCQDAFLLVNPRALFLYQQGGEITNDPIPKHSNVMAVDKRSLLRMAYTECLKSGDRSNFRVLEKYIVCHRNQVEYLFTVVGCGKCWLCTNAKRVDYINRSLLESANSLCPPMFITLTYDDDHLPRNGGVVSFNLRYSDVQKFFKRLRKRFASKGLPTDFRYLVAGEYGKQTHRPHYHIILWNNPYNCSEMQPHLFNQLRDDVFKSWSMCQPQGFCFEQCAGGAAHYVTKYLTKQVHYSDRDVQPFIHCSNKNGGLGSAILKRDKHYYDCDPNKQSFQLTTADGVFHDIPFGSYAKGILHPSPSRLVPARQKALYKELSDIFSMMVSIGAIDYDHAFDILEECRPYKSVIPHRLVQHDDDINLCDTARFLLAKKLRTASAAIMRELDLKSDVSVSDLRSYNEYLCRVIPVEDNRENLTDKRWRIAQNFANQLNKEVL